MLPRRVAVRSGPFSWRVPLRQIPAITPTRSPLSSPSQSLGRLRIDFGECRWLMVSLLDKAAFIAAVPRRG